mgnify:CR=1 FL=1|jgi:FMN phosphatase YigB (HAD superfamily)
MSEFKCALFDVGWTLFDEDYRWYKTCDWMSTTLRAFDIFIQPEQIKIQYESACARPDPSINSITKQCLVELGLPRDVIHTLCKRHPWHTFDFHPYEGALELLRRLSKMGVVVGILSNQGSHTRSCLDTFGFSPYCDFMLLSAEEGMMKPSKEFFELAIHRSECSPEDTLYFGDRLDHDVIGSSEVGMKSALILQGPHRRQYFENASPDFTFRFISEVLDGISPLDGRGFSVNPSVVHSGESPATKVR